MPDVQPALTGLTPDALSEWLAAEGQPAFRAESKEEAAAKCLAISTSNSSGKRSRVFAKTLPIDL
jgi:hypothetical protein